MALESIALPPATSRRKWRVSWDYLHVDVDYASCLAFTEFLRPRARPTPLASSNERSTGSVGFASGPACVAAEHAVVSLTKASAIECAKHGGAHQLHRVGVH